MEKSKNVRKAVYQIDETMKENFPPKPTSNEVKDELDYCQSSHFMWLKKNQKSLEYPAVKEKLNYLKEVVDDYNEQLELFN